MSPWDSQLADEVAYCTLSLETGIVQKRCVVTPHPWSKPVSFSANGDLLFFLDKSTRPTLLDWQTGRSIIGPPLPEDIKIWRTTAIDTAVSSQGSYAVVSVIHGKDSANSSGIYLVYDRNLQLLFKSQTMFNQDSSPLLVTEQGTILFGSGLMANIGGDVLEPSRYEPWRYRGPVYVSTNGNHLLEGTFNPRTLSYRYLLSSGVFSPPVCTFYLDNREHIGGFHAAISNTGTRLAFSHYKLRKVKKVAADGYTYDSMFDVEIYSLQKHSRILALHKNLTKCAF